MNQSPPLSPIADRERLARYATFYRRTLLSEVVPFWMRHGIDREYGGIGNVLDDAGNRLGNDKYLWSQGRALWTFAALYNRLERRPEWLDVASHIFRYLASHGLDERGHWMFRLDEEGRILDADISIFVDGFVLAGFTEYHAATGDSRALELALATYETTRRRIALPGSYRTAPYETPPGLKTHGVPLVFGLFYFELGRVARRPDIEAEGLRLADEILADFYSPEKDAILEFVHLDGSPVAAPIGRACVPGHAIEALWFIISICERSNRADARACIARCSRLIHRHLELAWDDEFGGLRLAMDIDGQEPPYWKNSNCKAWWVHVEALVATAYAHRHTGHPWCLQWHDRIQQYAFAHYPVATGEWTQWLDREGRKTTSAALPVKDPFHLPRALLQLMEVFTT